MTGRYETTLLISIIIMIGIIIIPTNVNSSPPPPTVTIIVVAGQSNAMYGNTGIEEMNECVPVPSHNVYYYGDEHGPIVFGNWDNPHYDNTFDSYGIHSMIDDNIWKIGTMDAIIGNMVSINNNCDVLVINTGISGANIAFLMPLNDGGKYITHVIEDAISKLVEKYKPHIIKAGYVWIQGESDNNTPIVSYKKMFTDIKNNFCTKGFDTCYMVQTRLINGGNASIAQLEICQDNKNVILASTAPNTFTIENGLMIDNLHYSGKGRFIVGVQVGNVISSSESNTPQTFPTMISAPKHNCTTLVETAPTHRI